MMNKFRQILVMVAGLSAVSLLWGSAYAAPMGVPQHWAPAYVPASSSHGVASFRPQYRPRPAAPIPQYYRNRGVPPQYSSARRPATWPIPISYRPIVRAPRYPQPPPYAYRGYGQRWPVRFMPGAGYQGRPMPRMAYYPVRPRTTPWGYRPYAYPGNRGYRPVAPVRYPQPNWVQPPRSVVRMPFYGNPPAQWANRPATPYRQVPGRLARYQPFLNPQRVKRDYRFRPMSRAMAHQNYPVPRPYPVRMGYPTGYQFRPGPRLRSPVMVSPRPNYVWPAPVVHSKSSPIWGDESVAWSSAPVQRRQTGY